VHVALQNPEPQLMPLPQLPLPLHVAVQSVALPHWIPAPHDWVPPHVTLHVSALHTTPLPPHDDPPPHDTTQNGPSHTTPFEHVLPPVHRISQLGLLAVHVTLPVQSPGPQSSRQSTFGGHVQSAPPPVHSITH
jgi:hypothetical protein